MHGIQQVEGIDYETISLFTPATDKACGLLKVAPYSLELLSFNGIIEPFCIT